MINPLYHLFFPKKKEKKKPVVDNSGFIAEQKKLQQRAKELEETADKLRDSLAKQKQRSEEMYRQELYRKQVEEVQNAYYSLSKENEWGKGDGTKYATTKYGTLYIRLKGGDEYGISNVLIPNKVGVKVSREFRVRAGETVIGYRFVRNVDGKNVGSGKLGPRYYDKDSSFVLTIQCTKDGSML